MEIKYIDAHAHLNEGIFDKDREKILKECREKGILVINCSGEPKSNRRSLELAKKFNNLKICLGLYPIQTTELSDKEFWNEIKFIEENVNKIVGIGEVGLDYYWVKEEEKRLKEIQAFKEIIWLANKLKLPLNVHSRAAEAETIAMLSKNAHAPVLLHSFGGDIEFTKHAVKEGFYFSIAPIVIRSNRHKRLVEALPIDKILTETDSPYLGPTQERNDPRNIPLVVEEIAKIKKIDVEVCRKQILENAKKVFDI